MTSVERRILYGLGLALAALLVLFIVGLLKIGSVSDHLIRDEAKTCAVQKRGLPAGHALAKVIGDLHTLVSAPLNSRQQKALAHAPKRVVDAYADLNKQAALYSQIESTQPHTRTC